MDKKTLTALRGSIRKWEAIVAGEGRDDGSDNCPLCAEFYENDCEGCPISKATGQAMCDGSPYEAWVDAHIAAERYNPLRIHDDDSAIAAVLELEFLKSLLPGAK